MPRRLFSGRSNTDPTTDQISKPVLVHTDALPRSDLQTLGRVKPWSAGTGAESQPAVNEWDQPPPSFHDRGYGSGPPSSSGSMASYPDPHTIGVALGSPSVYAQPPRFDTGTPRPDTANSHVQQAGSPPKRKTSKWRKIGGLFKAKHAIEKPSPAPFYQVRLNEQELQQQQQQQLRSSPETVSAPPVAQPPWANGYPKGHNYRVIFPEIEDDDHKHQDVNSGRKLNQDAQRSTEGSDQYQFPLREPPFDFLKDEEYEQPAEGKGEPLLDVDIPDVHMERYSVMFGNLLGKGNNRTTLLARRSRHLEKLKTHDEKRVEPGEDQVLKPPPRRATSPGPAKSPSFTLFPTAPKQSKSPAPQNAPSRPHNLHPLQKSHTAPIRPSSRNHESQPSSSSSQFTLTSQSPRPPISSNVWAAERNAYLSPIASEAPSTSSGGSSQVAKQSQSLPMEKKQEEKSGEKSEEKPPQGFRLRKDDENPIRAEEAMAQLEESTRQLRILAKSKDKKDDASHRPSTAEGRKPAHPTIATAMNNQNIALRENPPSRAPPHPPPNFAVPALPRERAQTAPSSSSRPKTPNSNQFPPRTSSAAASRAMTPPRVITASPTALSSVSGEDHLSNPDHDQDQDHNDNNVQVYVARSISVTKTANAQRIRQQQQKQKQQQKRQQKQQQAQQHCQEQKQPRHMLVPLGMKTQPFREDEKLVERYHSPQTPTLVENLSPGQSSGSGSSPFRRSQNVLIETA